MILVDWQIEEKLSDCILPFDPNYINPDSYDVHLGTDFKRLDKNPHGIIDPYDESTYQNNKYHRYYGESIIIDPGECILGTTKEYFKLPKDITASLEGKSSIARLWIDIHQTGGWIDAGFEGEITFEICNVGINPVRLYAGMPFGQLVFHKTKPCNRSYSDRVSSKYVRQKGATISKFWKNDVPSD